jgi:diaminohydroxyphosphoribosylaminopyrimidine deaminase/5-amino-6-(5-phosphoribosylamino)uracil reductase
MQREESAGVNVGGERTLALRSIEEALKSPGNTRVGVVIARDDKILATGFKGEVEGLHAEEVALEKARVAGTDLAGATLFATLEPCANSRTARIPCAELVAAAGIATVHIGEYDPNPQVNRLGWKSLRDQGVKLRDFPADLRAMAREVSADFTRLFTIGTGMSAGAKFDFTTNGGVFTIQADEHAGAASWKTRWSNCGASAIYLNGGVPGVVALARYAEGFDEIDDPDALDYGSHALKIEVGGVGVMRNEYGHVLCKVVAIEPTADYGGTGHVSVTIKWEIRLLRGGTAAHGAV